MLLLAKEELFEALMFNVPKGRAVCAVLSNGHDRVVVGGRTVRAGTQRSLDAARQTDRQIFRLKNNMVLSTVGELLMASQIKGSFG
jgi:hypothetical protein